MEVYDTCKYHVDPKSFEIKTPTFEYPTIVNRKKTTLILPNCNSSFSLIERLGSSIEVAIKCMKEYGLKTTIKKAEKLEMFFLHGIATTEILKEQGLKASETLRKQVTDFVSSLLKGETIESGVPQFKLSTDFIKELETIRYEAMFSSPNEMSKSIGYVGNIQDSPYMPFFQLDALTIEDVKFSCLVPKGEKGKYREALKTLKEKLFNSFLPVHEDILISILRDSTGRKADDEQYKKLLDNYLKALGITETFQDGKIWVKDEFLKTVYMRQARIIYNEGGAITRDGIAEIYRETYHEEMGVMSSQLAKMGFAYQGTKWVYGNTLRDAREIINHVVEEHGYIVKMSDIEYALSQAGLKYRARTIRAYVTNICVPCNNDEDLFCHKGHEVPPNMVKRTL